MRPVDKGACPTNAAGQNKTVTDYKSWRYDLVQRIGNYCVYCNIPLPNNLNVEHVVAKVAQAGAAAGSMFDWDNMLLACGPCNLAKSNHPVSATTHYLPEEHNTLLPLQIVVHPVNNKAGIVAVKAGLNGAQQVKAQSTITLCGLTAIDTRPKVVDLRWKMRREAMLAVDAIYAFFQESKQLPAFNAQIAALRIVTFAKSVGFFGIWFDTFSNEPEVIAALIDPANLPGTAQNCFDSANGYQFLPRNPGQADPI